MNTLNMLLDLHKHMWELGFDIGGIIREFENKKVVRLYFKHHLLKAGYDPHRLSYVKITNSVYKYDGKEFSNHNDLISYIGENYIDHKNR